MEEGEVVRLAVSLGCPCGIGPEVSVAAVAGGVPGARVTLYGDAGATEEAARLRGLELRSLPGVGFVPTSELAERDRVPGRPSVGAGAAQLAAIDAALQAVLSGEADAIVTAPVSKLVISQSGTPFLGHTEYLAERAGVQRVVMLFAGPRLRTSLVTTHLPLHALPAAITLESVRSAVVLTARAMHEDFGCADPVVAVTGLNPHAGEGGLLGREEDEVIAPAMEAARVQLHRSVTLVGPLAAEAAFRQARDGRYAAVVAMYHDQATIASKLLDFGDAVNVTLGLPFVRTSVDHGTAYDLAGRGEADPRGMTSALSLAVTLARGRARRHRARR